MSRPQAVFILPSEGYRIGDFVEAADRLGVGMVVATDAHHGMAEEMGATLVPIDFSRPHDAARRIAASSADIAAVVPIDDRGVGIAAEAAAIRDLAHNPTEAVLGTRDKAVLRASLAGAVDQPEYAVVVEEASVPEFGPPWVVKPVGLAGSIGVIRVDDPAELSGTVERIRRIQTDHGYPADHPLLIETYVPGTEVALEGLLTDGTWETLAIFDKPDPMDGPYFAETHYVTPSRHDPVILERLESTARAATHRLGLRQGPVHAEFRIDGDRVVLLELAARPIGGLCGRALRFGLADTSLEEVLIRNALGERVRGTRQAPGASGVTMIPVPGEGVFEGIAGIEDAEAVDGVTSIEESTVRGTKVAPLPDASIYLGFVFARADDPASVEAALRKASSILRVRIG